MNNCNEHSRSLPCLRVQNRHWLSSSPTVDEYSNSRRWNVLPTRCVAEIGVCLYSIVWKYWAFIDAMESAREIYVRGVFIRSLSQNKTKVRMWVPYIDIKYSFT